jgi:hypothetical protein
MKELFYTCSRVELISPIFILNISQAIPYLIFGTVWILAKYLQIQNLPHQILMLATG